MKTIVFCHPAPGAAGFDPEPAVTAARHVELVSIDRPGYGDAPPPTDWATVGSAADQIATLVEQRGCGPVGVAGWSAGGRVALALAARRPDLVERVVVLGTPAPQAEVPWIPPQFVDALEALRGQPSSQVHAALESQLAQLPRDTAILGDDVPSDPGLRARLEAMLQRAFAKGAAGVAADIAGYCLRPWGFAPSEVRAKTLLLYGSKDPVAGVKHGHWWKQQLPNSRLETVPAAGHIGLLGMWSRTLSHLAPNR